MYQLIETLRILDGKYNNLNYHAKRMNLAWSELFKIQGPFTLQEILQHYPVPTNGLYKCRVTYDRQVRAVEFVPYQYREVNSLKLIHDDTIVYPHKFEDRVALEGHFAHRGNCDDILIIKNGFVTDTTSANVVFKKGNEWVTPVTCLLPGTMRQSLIDEKIIREENIRSNEIQKFKTFRLINSMVGWGGPEVKTSQIVD